MYNLRAEAFFDSAHFLADYHGKCENLHGHRWRLVVTIGAHTLNATGDERGMVCDFATFKQAVRDLAGEYDHTFLIEEGTLMPQTIQALEEEGFTLKVLPFRTTAENLAKHFSDRLRESGWKVVCVEVDETPHNQTLYTPDEER